MYNMCSRCRSTGGREYLCDRCYTEETVMLRNMVTWLLERLDLSDEELPRDIRKFVLDKGCDHPGGDADCPHNYVWTCDHCPIVESMHEPPATFLGKTFDMRLMHKFYTAMKKNDCVHSGRHILDMMLVYEITTEGCGIRPEKQYKVHCMMDSLTFEEI